MDLASLAGTAIAQNGPLTRDQIVALVGAKIPPEVAYRACSRRDKEEISQDEVIAAGRRSMVVGSLAGWVKRGLLYEGQDGRLYPTPRFRRDFPESFIDELKGTPWHELGQWIEKAISTSHSQAATGIRVVLRRLLVMAGRDVMAGACNDIPSTD